MSDTYRPTRAEIDLSAVRHNVAAMGEHVAEGVERLAVVKANAYGHGDLEVARACLAAGATRLGVALVEEGVRLRDAGIDAPVLVLVEPPPAAAAAVVANELTASVSTIEVARALGDAASSAGRRTLVHACVDTGMHREGVAFERALEFVQGVVNLPGLELEGLWSHFAVGEQEAHPFTEGQVERFADLCQSVAARGIDIPVRHLSSSGGIVLYPAAHFQMVRMGIMIYGLYPHVAIAGRIDLRAAMRLVSEVGLVRRVPAGEGVSYGLTYVPERDTTIATVPIGYADGYPRLLSSRGEVLVRGRRRRIAGRVTMDQIMIDCGDDEVAGGDEVVLLGSQGEEEITADELAEHIGTINYEIVSAVGARVPRRFLP